jgi:solute carrier family 50 protein (sugar transporter)|mmetsp:Transcript_21070/g.45658  ORF Transcript_21070/g.45658 Transcript_21070/m.45658 type:complete len:282 (+) Transcript_21070:112-957(+)
MKTITLLTSALALLARVHPSDAWIGRPASTIPRSNRLPNDASAKSFSKGPMRVRGGSSLDLSLDANAVVTTLVPRIGVVTSTLLYFSPLTTVRKASNEGSLGDLNPIPLAIMAVSSLCWLAYGLSIRDPYVTLSNVPGCVASIWYVTAILPLLKGEQLKSTQSIVLALSAVTINLWTWLSLSKKTMTEVSSALGLFASFLFILLSGSPLSTIKTVFVTKNAGSILTQLTIAQVSNTALWSLYGLAIKDKFVYYPNLTGLGFGLIQLALKLLFPSKQAKLAI